MAAAALDIGALSIDDKVNFKVWAPLATSVDVELVDSGAMKIPLQRDGQYFQGVVAAAAGDRYWYWLDGMLRRPDPASRSQPDGVHGPSRVIDPAFAWSDRE
jgi:maltooligosyltrehalose trehalohydrolase